MPLFRRHSQKETKPEAADDKEDHSLLGRLTRRHTDQKGSLDGSSSHATTTSQQTSLPSHPKPVHDQSPQPSAGLSIDTKRSSSRDGHHHSSHSRDHSSHDKDARSSSRSSSKDEDKASGHPASSRDVARDEQVAVVGRGDGLTREDVKLLFHGAPQFMLEAGRRRRYFPQSFFPWQPSLDVTDLQDRAYLKHESFALCTMHARLPIPYEVDPRKEGDEHIHRRDPFERGIGGNSAKSPSSEAGSAGFAITAATGATPEGRETSKRPMFDMGLYERPNMLSLHGVEPGTVGMRNYLELPVADGLITHDREEHGGADSDIGAEHGYEGLGDLENVSAFEAFKMLLHDEGSANIGKHAPMQDRVQILKGGPKMWKKIGVRGLTMKTITQRLQDMSALRNRIVERGWRYTLLDEVGQDALGKQLFEEFLFPPNKIKEGLWHQGLGDLKVQIEALVKVLTTPGVWLDFSLPAERLMLSQNLYTREVKGEDVRGIKPEEKRRWTLIQLLLAIELVIRLDAALRKGVAMHSKDLPISNEEIRHFNKLRNLKVDWDLVVARRWLDLCYAKCMPNETHHSQNEQGVTRSREQPTLSRFGRLKNSLSFDQSDEDPDNTNWDVAILPRQAKVMAEGLVRFGADLGWPQQNLDAIRQSLIVKLRDATQEERERMLSQGVETLEHPHVPQHSMDKATTVELRQATEKTLGGPLSHAWLGGLVIPGYISCDLLMCTLLEHDPEALEKLGTSAHPRSGFVLDGKSYWSKTCIIGTVLAGMEGAKHRMGWIALPENVGPVDEELESFGDGWKIVDCASPPKLRDGARIFDGESMSKESSVLGVGHGKVLSREFSMVTDHILDDLRGKFELRDVELMLNKSKGHEKNGTAEYTASVGFQVIEGDDGTGEGEMKQLRIQLKYHVQFIGGHPCRPPHGHLGVQSPDTEGAAGSTRDEILGRPTSPASDAVTSPIRTISTTTMTTSTTSPSHPPHRHHPKHKHAEHLPAHPLHKSYKYSTKSIAEILELGENDWLPNPMDKEGGTVWIVDARGGWEREVAVRAWCAKVGRDAVISRVGKGCLSCAVREARALEVGVIVRIGE